ncbi:hypothetical protein BCR34DRAFT_557367 [Clohesyomyces aquaticus]|uniref:Uncharacterized protein n=1 Tax=Clohesyomyces aquaticus TaxID=1231657 RepID=A0A1Y2A135_9PLEO|nr:hypothetical protein BCR34DRAFT_557367 [Clohesyomyces aquaticus]
MGADYNSYYPVPPVQNFAVGSIEPCQTPASIHMAATRVLLFLGIHCLTVLAAPIGNHCDTTSPFPAFTASSGRNHWLPRIMTIQTVESDSTKLQKAESPAITYVILRRLSGPVPFELKHGTFVLIYHLSPSNHSAQFALGVGEHWQSKAS